jgi:hypothetical protein
MVCPDIPGADRRAAAQRTASGTENIYGIPRICDEEPAARPDRCSGASNRPGSRRQAVGRHVGVPDSENACRSCVVGLIRAAVSAAGCEVMLVAEEDAAERRIRTGGLQRAEFSVEEGNPRARALYQRLGYVAYGSEPDAWDAVGQGRLRLSVRDHVHAHAQGRARTCGRFRGREDPTGGCGCRRVTTLSFSRAAPDPSGISISGLTLGLAT